MTWSQTYWRTCAPIRVEVCTLCPDVDARPVAAPFTQRRRWRGMTGIVQVIGPPGTLQQAIAASEIRQGGTTIDRRLKSPEAALVGSNDDREVRSA